MSQFSTNSPGAAAVPVAEEKAFKTHKSNARYHALLNLPFSIPLATQGYIIGIEKSPRDAIGHPNDKSHDTDRLTEPQPREGLSDFDLSQQRRDFKRVTDDPKAMFVSHILKYAPDEERNAITPRLLHSAYSGTGFDGSSLPEPGINLMAAGDPETPYEAGYTALSQMVPLMIDDVAKAKEAGRPFTHLLIMSMGWNNDQFEALERYNDLVMQTARNTGGADFNPLVVGITWPSVWAFRYAKDFTRKLTHISSYPNKTMDADEIGFTVMNVFLNHLVPQVENATGLRSVLVGHSMGARILSRAYYSGGQLVESTARSGRAPILIGLQGAFSSNRFAENYKLLPPVRWFISGEGGPYQDVNAPGGHVALTWASQDLANPVARFASGAPHVGGRFGAIEFAKAHLENKVLALPWQGAVATESACKEAVDLGLILYLDASNIIGDHGDIRDAEVGRLVWSVIKGFEAAEP